MAYTDQKTEIAPKRARLFLSNHFNISTMISSKICCICKRQKLDMKYKTENDGPTDLRTDVRTDGLTQ